ncbi:MAG: hypothetical protein IJJ16_04455 [Mogibacterium sp.]|nr:hypothetical protein [Mogibacterium sp.]
MYHCIYADINDSGQPDGDKMTYIWDTEGGTGHYDLGDAPQFDDITMLAFRYNGKQK